MQVYRRMVSVLSGVSRMREELTLQLFFERYHHFVPGMIQALSRHLDTNLSREQLETIETKTFQRMLNYPFWMSFSRDSIQDYIYQLVREAIPGDYGNLSLQIPDPEVVEEAWSCMVSGLVHRRISQPELERLNLGQEVFLDILNQKKRGTCHVYLQLEPTGLNVLLDRAGLFSLCYIFHGNEVYREAFTDGRAFFRDVFLEEMIISLDLKHFMRIYVKDHTLPEEP